MNLKLENKIRKRLTNLLKEKRRLNRQKVKNDIANKLEVRKESVEEVIMKEIKEGDIYEVEKGATIVRTSELDN